MQHNYKGSETNNSWLLKNGWLMRSLNYIGAFVGFILIATSLINAVISLQNQRLKKTAYLVVKDRSIELEVARTPESQARGLMNRYDLNGKGMLFPVQPPKVVSVWMKNVRVPLDIVFVRQGRVVAIAHSTPPCHQESCPIYKPPVPVDAVVELPAGMAGKLGLSVKTALRLRNSDFCSGMQTKAIARSAPATPSVLFCSSQNRRSHSEKNHL